MSESKSETIETKTFDHELSGKYLTVKLSGEKYGVPISPIDDIIEMKEITSIPQTPDFVEGVINLRGSVIPVVNLSKRFNLDQSEFDRKTCIVVVTLRGIQTGLIVDRVREVTDFADEQIDPAPKMSQKIQTEFIAGLGKTSEQVHILLNIEKVLAEDQVQELDEIANDNEAAIDTE